MTHPLAHLNPDCMVVDDLACLARNLRRLAHYCTLREHGMRHRLAGDISAAQQAETLCDAIYARIPREWRW
jgi:hypothetical protein